MKIIEAIELCQKYGENTTLGELRKKIQGKKIHRCPKCEGNGYIVEEYNAYPSGFPDSGWVYEPGYRNITCDLCDGEGFTENEFRPRMVQDGWEEVK